MSGAIRECLCCEKSFSPEAALEDGVQSKYTNQYCSKACEEIFESSLEESVEESKNAGLIDTEGAPIMSSKEAATANDLNNLVKHFNQRHKI